MLTALAAVVLLTGCEELFFVQEPGTDPRSIFDQVWTFADREYSFFEYKGIDWDAVREEYEPQITPEMDERELFNVLADMLFELRDGHVNLVTDFNLARNWQWFIQEPPNYDSSVLERYYFTSGGTGTVGERSIHEYVGDAFILMDFRDPAGNVGYIHYRSFGSPVTQDDMDYVIARFSGDDYRGLIIDVRSNGGGSLSNVYTIAERFNTTGAAVPFLEEQVKTGPARDDFSAPRTRAISAPEEVSVYERPVVVLTNAESYSATNTFAAAMQALGNVRADIHLMGQPTGGGGGLPAYTELTNGWTLRVSTTRAFMVDPDAANQADPNIEGGVVPDELVTSPDAGLAAGVDGILEAALAHLR